MTGDYNITAGCFNGWLNDLIGINCYQNSLLSIILFFIFAGLIIFLILFYSLTTEGVV
jgi:hypothetical protein